MNDHDPFEQDLHAGLRAERAPDSLYRRIAEIPSAHPRIARHDVSGIAPLLRRIWSAVPTATWTASLSAAAASLVVGFWLGFAGLVATDASASDDDLAALVFDDVPTTIGEEP